MRSAIVIVMVLACTGVAVAQQQTCAVCEPSLKLRTELRTLNLADEQQKPKGEQLGTEGLKLLQGFGSDLPPPKQGSRAFEALVNLSLYAAPFTKDSQYEKTLAAIAKKSPDYRKQYQKMIRKGLRSKDQRERCQVRFLQTNVSMQECKMQELEKDGSEELAHKRCHASYGLTQCLAGKR